MADIKGRNDGADSDLDGLVQRHIARRLQPGTGWILACSGGRDSMVLGAVLLKQWLDAANQVPRPSFRVFHVNYGLRGSESDGDEGFVRQFFGDRGIEVVVYKVPSVSQPQSGIQEWARRIRYRFFDRERRREERIFVGHHKDDLAESILFRLVRGTPWYHLAGMDFVSADQVYHRPFLYTPRSQIDAYASRHNVPTREDSSNSKIIYTRNRLRHRVLPELDVLHKAARAKIVDHGVTTEAVGLWAEQQLRQNQNHHGHYLATAWLRSLPAPVAILALRTLKVSGLEDLKQAPEGRLQEAWLATQQDHPHRTINLADGFRLVVRSDTVVLLRPQRRQSCRRWFGMLPPLSTVAIEVIMNADIVNKTKGWLNINLCQVSGRQRIWNQNMTAMASVDLADESAVGGWLIDIDQRPRALYQSGSLWGLDQKGIKIRLEDWLVSIQDQMA